MCTTCKESYSSLSSLPGLSFWLHAFVRNVRLHGSGFYEKMFPNMTSLLVAQMETICKESKSVNAGI